MMDNKHEVLIQKSNSFQYIRECAEVKFIFDETRMKDLTTYPHLKDFVTSDDKTQLWYKTKGTAKDEAPA